MLPDGGGDDEERWLAEGISGVQQNAFYMHRALDSNNIKDALKYSAQMLSELRTSRLSPHKYYELYMRAFDEMRKLEMFFREETRRGGCSVVDLYELVQHAGNVLPRLHEGVRRDAEAGDVLQGGDLPGWLLGGRSLQACAARWQRVAQTVRLTLGSVYIKSKEAPAKDVLKDLVEMCRGIQHPLRGLFLRSYLSQISRDKLPDIGSEYEGFEIAWRETSLASLGAVHKDLDWQGMHTYAASLHLAGTGVSCDSRFMLGVDKRATITTNWPSFVNQATIQQGDICAFRFKHKAGHRLSLTVHHL